MIVVPRLLRASVLRGAYGSTSGPTQSGADSHKAPWGHDDVSAPPDKLVSQTYTPSKKALIEENMPDWSNTRPVYGANKAAKSRIHSWGPTIADKTVQFVVMDDNNARWKVRAIANGTRSVFEAAAEAGVPGFKRGPHCGMPGEKAEANCGYCHLVMPKRVYDQTPAPIDYEWTTLSELESAAWRWPTSRLTCQLPLDETYDGCTMLLPTRPQWWEDTIQARMPSNRMRGMRGNNDTYMHARSLRITPTRELFVSGKSNPALVPKDMDDSEPRFIDRLWSSTPARDFKRKRGHHSWFSWLRAPRSFGTRTGPDGSADLVGGYRLGTDHFVRFFG